MERVLLCGCSKGTEDSRKGFEVLALVKMVLRWGEILTGNIKKLFNFLKGVL